MVTPISTNVALIFGNLVVLERLKVLQRDEESYFYLVSPWVKDVVFPLAEFGIYDTNFGSALTQTSEILGEMSRKGTEVKVCTLHYLSDALNYKNPHRFSNPIETVDQALSNIEEIDVLRDFQTRGASIYLNRNFHSKIIVCSLGLYVGSFNFTLSGYYRNREDGYYVPNISSDKQEYQQKLSETRNEFLREDLLVSARDLDELRKKHQRIIEDTRHNWDRLMKEYLQRASRKTQRKIASHGII